MKARIVLPGTTPTPSPAAPTTPQQQAQKRSPFLEKCDNTPRADVEVDFVSPEYIERRWGTPRTSFGVIKVSEAFTSVVAEIMSQGLAAQMKISRDEFLALTGTNSKLMDRFMRCCDAFGSALLVKHITGKSPASADDSVPPFTDHSVDDTRVLSYWEFSDDGTMLRIETSKSDGETTCTLAEKGANDDGR